ncbi:MAG: hypothetical protein JJT94_16075 [Bernardetiaceae bacterium]|nr:hypothetical protein [Bernardetiaceae bacterium]
MMTKTLSYIFIPLLLTLWACEGKKHSELEGKWFEMSEENPDIFDFNTEKQSVVINNLDKRTYSFRDEHTMDMTWQDMKDTYKVRVNGDSLFMTSPDARRIFLREHLFGEPKELLARKLQAEAQMQYGIEVLNVSLVAYKGADLKGKFHLAREGEKGIADDESIYKGEVRFVKGLPATVLVREGRDKAGWLIPAWEETYESTILRYLNGRMGLRPDSVSLTRLERAKFDGIAYFGEQKLNLDVDGESGPYPKNTETDMGVFLTETMRVRFGDALEKVELASKGDFTYHGNVHFKNEKSTIPISLTYKRSWELEDTPESNKIYAKHYLSQQLGKNFEVVAAQKKTDAYLYELKDQESGESIKVLSTINQGWSPLCEKTNLERVIAYQYERTVYESKVNAVNLKAIGEQFEGTVEIEGKGSNEIEVTCTDKDFRWQFKKNAATSLR